MLMNVKRVIKCGWVAIEGRAKKNFHWKIEVEIWPSSKWRICKIRSFGQPNANVAWIFTIYKHQHTHFLCLENSEGLLGPWKASAASLLQRRVWNTVMKPVDAEAKLPGSQPCTFQPSAQPGMCMPTEFNKAPSLFHEFCQAHICSKY